MSYNEALFKVKKMVVETRDGKTEQYVGFLIPKTYRGDILSNKYEFVEINGSRVDINHYYMANVQFKATKIMNENVREALKKMINKEKERYKLSLQVQALKEQIDGIIEDTSIIHHSIPAFMGLMTQAEFKIYLGGLSTNTKGYVLELQTSGGRLTKFSMEKEVVLGKYVRAGEYSFIDEEYDGYLVPADIDLGKNEQFVKLKNEHFNEYGSKVVEKQALCERFEVNVGDKRTVWIAHTIEVVLTKPLDLTKENAKYIASLMEEILVSI